MSHMAVRFGRTAQWAATVFVLLALAACTAPAAAKPTPRPSDDAGIAWATCMRQQRVSVTDPQSGKPPTIDFSEGSDQAAIAAALEACQSLAAGVAPPPGQQPDSEELDRALGYAKCMRARGVDWPDPKIENGAIALLAPDTIDLRDPNVQAADEACYPIVIGGPSPSS
jgi:uncharacterized membrane protein